MSLTQIAHGGLLTTFSDNSYPNRVTATGGVGLSKRRLESIALDTGGTITINYATPDCTPTSVATLSPATNNHECFPQYWTVPGSGDKLDWFNKYPVAKITANPPSGPTGSYGTITSYSLRQPGLAPGPCRRHLGQPADLVGLRRLRLGRGPDGRPGQPDHPAQHCVPGDVGEAAVLAQTVAGR